MTSGEFRLFDVFETLLVRQVGEPSSVFLLLGHRLLEAGLTSMTPERFARDRDQAYHRARRRATPRDVSLADIYRELADVHSWSTIEAEILLEKELELESQLLQTWPPGVDALASARRIGARIVFVSDTQLPEAFLWRQLLVRNLARDGDTLFASCEWNSTKLSGQLFSVVLDAIGADPASVAHTGNDFVTDIRSARRSGLRTNFIPSGNLNRFEVAMESHRFSTGGFASALAGASRLARGEGSDEDALVDIAASVAAPVITGYVLWLLRRAEIHRVDRLYFLAREGQFLQRLAIDLADRRGIDVKCSYLHGSRLSLNLAALSSMDRLSLSWVLTHSHTDTLRNQLRRVGLEPESYRSELHEAGLSSDTWDTIPSRPQHELLVDALGKAPLRESVLAAAADQRELVGAYLEEVGFLDPVPVGIVDSAGIGSQLRALASLRTAAGLSAPRGYLFARTRGLSLDGEVLDANLASFEGYLEDSVRGLGVGRVPGLIVLLEQFLAADHGTVLGYARSENGSVAPVTAAPPTTDRMAGVDSLRTTTERFLDYLVLDDGLVDVEADVRNMSRSLLTELWSSPTREEAQALRGLWFEDGTGQSASEEICRPVRVVELVPYLLRTRRRLQTGSRWQAGSLAVSGRSVRATYLTLRGVRRWVRRLFDALP